ncbi:hypothetical protein [Paenibacillus nasutitermitis]|uniref:Uncharacterized protein n=1 Tax=Paenibacillus nasutitermitis TaxID=1652958 RepID=A0A916YJ15_9BACL|nr:hypothetical protein [Paenibacillus nasutitermitis]GGD47477.1 hypothetical protein GCM10010911_01220 [Paenibacillus nasutitermitis]
MTTKVKSYGITVLAAIFAATLFYFVYLQVNRSSQGEARRATANNIDMALDTSPVVVIGRVIDDQGITRNLRRDSTDPTKEDQTVSVPGTDYKVEVIKVLKGEVQPNSQINVAVPGGTYKGESAKLQATLAKNGEYIFALAPSPSGPASYFGMIEPYIFQLKNNKVMAVTNDNQVKSAFQETNLTEADLDQKFTKP